MIKTVIMMTKPLSSSDATLSILFFGDIVGRPGRKAVAAYLAHRRTEGTLPDVVIANGENATHGFGLNEGHYKELLTAGVNIVTGGNHIWDRPEIVHYIEKAEYLVRPANFPANMPGRGAAVFEVNGHKIGVINLLGQVFMGNYNIAWEQLEKYVKDLQAETPVVFLDFHAEATAEKISMAHYCAGLKLSCMAGTHTHVQTADERVINEQLGYITDAGFNGIYNSVIGMDVQSSLLRLKSFVPSRLEVATGPVAQLNAVEYQVNKNTGRCQSVQRINTQVDLKEQRVVQPQACSIV